MEILTFFVEVVVGLLVSTAAVVSLNKPLAHLLSELCGTSERAEFWARYTNIMLYITPLLGVVMFGRITPSPDIDFALLKGAFKSSLFGLFVAVVIGFQLVRFTRNQAEVVKESSERKAT